MRRRARQINPKRVALRVAAHRSGRTGWRRARVARMCEKGAQWCMIRVSPFPHSPDRDRLSVEQLGGTKMRRPWPFAAQAQQRERVRRIGVLLPGDENSPAWKNYFPLFARGLQDLGWVDGRTCAWMFVGLAAI